MTTGITSTIHNIIGTSYSHQKNYFYAGKTIDIQTRIECLEKMKHILKANEQAMEVAIYKDFGKSAFDTFATEIGHLYHDINENLSQIRHWTKPTRVPTNLVNMPGRSYIVPEPLGVCLVIGAWNYPYLLTLAPVIPAIAAGNTVLIKPSELPIHTSNLMAKMINDNFDPAYLKVIEGGIPETTALLELPLDKIFFTGSVPVGKIVYQAAAKNLTPVTLELGGKSPAIIHKDAKLDMCVKRLVWGKFLNAGQTCIAPDYLMVHQDIVAQLIDKIKAELTRSNYAKGVPHYTQIINNRNFKRLIDLIDTNKVIFGGHSDEDDRYIEPTLMYPVDWSDKVMQDEIFGPILPILTYSDDEVMITQLKSLEKPLSLYVFSESKAFQDKILHQISFGGGCVNDVIMHIANPNLPFGGVGHSGIGSYHGYKGFEAFCHKKSIFKKPTWMELPLKFPPYTSRKLNLIKFLLEKL